MRPFILLTVLMKLFLVLTVFTTLLLSDDKYYNGNYYKDKDRDSKYYGSKPTRKGVAPVNNALYTNECGACHFAYQPGLLPADSWRKMMGNLENHFGTDATVSQEDFVSLSNYLEQNSAEKNMHYKRSSRIVNSLRGRVANSISETPYIIEKHEDIRPSLITQKEVKGLFNCKACHITAQTGSYSDDDVRIPNFGRWQD